MKDVRTIILAAGKGVRMRSKLPKVLHEVCGRSLIESVVDVAKAAGSLKLYVVLGHQSQRVREVLGPECQVVLQERLRGTADAVRCAGKFLEGQKGHVLVLCGDAPLLRKRTVQQLIRKHKKTGADCTFLTAVVDDARGYGRIIRGDQARSLAIREEKDASEDEKNIMEINVGVYCFRCKVLFDMIRQIQLNTKKKEFYLTDIVEILCQKGFRVETVEIEDAVEGLGVNDREDLAKAEAIMRQRILKQFMQQGVTIVDPQNTFIGAGVQIGRDTVIRPFTYIEKNVRIGSDCVIGPFARLRSGTRIGHHGTVGNFAEISRSQLKEYCVMKHFGFLGDARIGRQVNIGAGTVTANYDGKNKNVTFIHDQAFIGSDSVMVAPVWVGKKAVVGAGCVVTKGKRIPPGKVVVGVPGRIIEKK